MEEPDKEAAEPDPNALWKTKEAGDRVKRKLACLGNGKTVVPVLATGLPPPDKLQLRSPPPAEWLELTVTSHMGASEVCILCQMYMDAVGSTRRDIRFDQLLRVVGPHLMCSPRAVAQIGEMLFDFALELQDPKFDTTLTLTGFVRTMAILASDKVDERLAVLFHLFDVSGDGQINVDEARDMLTAGLIGDFDPAAGDRLLRRIYSNEQRRIDGLALATFVAEFRTVGAAAESFFCKSLVRTMWTLSRGGRTQLALAAPLPAADPVEPGVTPADCERCGALGAALGPREVHRVNTRKNLGTLYASATPRMVESVVPALWMAAAQLETVMPGKDVPCEVWDGRPRPLPGGLGKETRAHVHVPSLADDLTRLRARGSASYDLYTLLLHAVVASKLKKSTWRPEETDDNASILADLDALAPPEAEGGGAGAAGAGQVKTPVALLEEPLDVSMVQGGDSEVFTRALEETNPTVKLKLLYAVAPHGVRIGPKEDEERLREKERARIRARSIRTEMRRRSSVKSSSVMPASPLLAGNAVALGGPSPAGANLRSAAMRAVAAESAIPGRPPSRDTEVSSLRTGPMSSLASQAAAPFGSPANAATGVAMMALLSLEDVAARQRAMRRNLNPLEEDAAAEAAAAEAEEDEEESRRAKTGRPLIARPPGAQRSLTVEIAMQDRGRRQGRASDAAPGPGRDPRRLALVRSISLMAGAKAKRRVTAGGGLLEPRRPAGAARPGPLPHRTGRLRVVLDPSASREQPSAASPPPSVASPSEATMSTASLSSDDTDESGDEGSATDDNDDDDDDDDDGQNEAGVEPDWRRWASAQARARPFAAVESGATGRGARGGKPPGETADGFVPGVTGRTVGLESTARASRESVQGADGSLARTLLRAVAFNRVEEVEQLVAAAQDRVRGLSPDAAARSFLGRVVRAAMFFCRLSHIGMPMRYGTVKTPLSDYLGLELPMNAQAGAVLEHVGQRTIMGSYRTAFKRILARQESVLLVEALWWLLLARYFAPDGAFPFIEVLGDVVRDSYLALTYHELTPGLSDAGAHDAAHARTPPVQRLGAGARPPSGGGGRGGRHGLAILPEAASSDEEDEREDEEDRATAGHPARATGPGGDGISAEVFALRVGARRADELRRVLPLALAAGIFDSYTMAFPASKERFTQELLRRAMFDVYELLTGVTLCNSTLEYVQNNMFRILGRDERRMLDLQRAQAASSREGADGAQSRRGGAGVLDGGSERVSSKLAAARVRRAEHGFSKPADAESDWRQMRAKRQLNGNELRAKVVHMRSSQASPLVARQLARGVGEDRPLFTSTSVSARGFTTPGGRLRFEFIAEAAQHREAAQAPTEAPKSEAEQTRSRRRGILLRAAAADRRSASTAERTGPVATYGTLAALLEVVESREKRPGGGRGVVRAMGILGSDRELRKCWKLLPYAMREAANPREVGDEVRKVMRGQEQMPPCQPLHHGAFSTIELLGHAEGRLRAHFAATQNLTVGLRRVPPTEPPKPRVARSPRHVRDSMRRSVKSMFPSLINPVLQGLDA